MERQHFQAALSSPVTSYPDVAAEGDQPKTPSSASTTPDHLGLVAILAQFRRRLISLRTMSWPQRALTIFAIGAVALTGLLILGGASGPSVDISGGGKLPVAILVGTPISLVVAWSL